MKLPVITVLAGRDKRVRSGYPWVFSNEIQMDQNARAIAPGSVVKLQVEGGPVLGTAIFNPHTLIAARRLDAAVVAIDEAWFVQKLSAAQAVRERFYKEPYYRLVHAEADGLPGLIVDRYGDVLTVQANTAGMDKLLNALVPALQKVTGATANPEQAEPATTHLRKEMCVVLNRSGPAIALEGLAEESRVLAGSLPAEVSIKENGVVYKVDPVNGQKTGWFYDQRENRAYIASLAKGQSVFDGYCYAGGFGLLAAVQGATSVTFVDASQAALDLARKSAEANSVADKCSFKKADVMDALAGGEKYDVVIVDPPAFIKNKKDMAAGLKGYRKLARLAAAATGPGGILAICTCSHHADLAEWSAEVARGIYDAGRSARLLRTSGAGPDHPVHPLLPESAYLKCQVFALD